MNTQNNMQNLLAQARRDEGPMAYGVLIAAVCGVVTFFSPQSVLVWPVLGVGLGFVIFGFGLMRFEKTLSLIRGYEFDLCWAKRPSTVAEFICLTGPDQEFMEDLLTY
ncbi:MAG: hypothetical protein A3J48_03160 [Candidatus Doudnabacteria bacterium RIFCSPHIGHO2_02_FULL_46_11]|uniref:Uncharacterized protein n=1 Tax=Candidatus Doudnabacteria bacterium RIFCSPHIGHO2_02_FULL_46_11 TaxID=1817832 RepID=A0A1F5P7U5_9BACT|nr:MAG: hypothetical protein A3J48_03160 [Candidatus Doudnabacteria bacterium RIFCSPHIGHO2_02_FULL_46_11]